MWRHGIVIVMFDKYKLSRCDAGSEELHSDPDGVRDGRAGGGSGGSLTSTLQPPLQL